MRTPFARLTRPPQARRDAPLPESDFGAQDRLEPGLARYIDKPDRAIETIGVRQRERVHALSARRLAERLHRRDAFHRRIIRVDVKMNKRRHGDSRCSRMNGSCRLAAHAPAIPGRFANAAAGDGHWTKAGLGRRGRVGAMSPLRATRSQLRRFTHYSRAGGNERDPGGAQRVTRILAAAMSAHREHVWVAR